MNQVRIIAGKWRSRILRFPNHIQLRPTHDRIRETVFNWLSPYIAGANCLDLFAGSGAFGFESLSRDAQHVVMVDSHNSIVTSLRNNAKQLDTQDCDIILATFPDIRLANQRFNIVFLDPPYEQGLISSSLDWLIENQLLADDARVYFEAERSLEIVVPNGFEIIRHKSTRSLQYGLIAAVT